MKYLLASVILFITACKSSETQLAEENERLNAENAKLRKQLYTKKKTNNAGSNEEKRNIDARFEYLQYATDLLLDDDKLVGEAFYLLFENTNTDEFLYNLSFMINPGHNRHLLSDDNEQSMSKTNLVFDKDFFFFYLWKELDKSPENITELYARFGKWSSEFIPYLTEIQRQELIDLTAALVLSYEEVGEDRVWLEDMYAKADTVNVLADLSYFDKVSPEVNALLSKYGSANDIAYDRWTYSFWVRRHQESNAEVFYAIIKEINGELEGYVEEY